jgi:hypothetical protein
MDIEAMESCKGGVEKMGWVPAAVEGSEFDRPQEFIISSRPA